MARIKSSVNYRSSDGSRRTVYSTPESVKKTEDLIRSRGETPGKISSGSVSRSSSGKKTYRDSSGSVTKIEEPVSVDGQKGTRTTTYSKSPDLKGAPGDGSRMPDTPDLYDPNTGRQLTPFEAYAVTTRDGAMTDARTGETVYSRYTPPEKQEKRLFKDSFYRDYPYLAAQKEAEVKEQIFSPATATLRRAANRNAFELRTEKALRSAVENAQTETEFKRAAENLRSYRKAQILSSREGYGDLSPKTDTIGQRLSAVPKSIAGGFSLGLKTVGSATEELLYEKEQQLRFKDRQAIGKDETGVYALNVLKDSSRGAAITGLKVSRGVIKGAVTDTGSSRLQGALFAASGVLGGVSGFAKATGISAKVSAASKQSVYVRSAVRGTGLGLKTVGVGALGSAGLQAARSPDPTFELSRLGGRLVAFSGAYKTGQAGGYEFGVLAKSTAPAVSRAISNIRLPEAQPMGKKGAAFRGGRRVSPKSKTQIRQESRGTYRDPRVTQQRDKTTFKIRNKDLKDRFVKQRNIAVKQDGSYTVQDKGLRSDVQALKGSGTPSNKIRYRTSQAIKNPKASGDYILVKKPGFRKTVPVRVNPTAKTSQSSPGQVQILQQQKPVTSQIPKTPTGKNINLRLNDQKNILKGDPARSQFAAQNIRSDPLKVDLGTPPTSTTKAAGGFRTGVSKASIVGQERITYLKSGLRDVRSVSLPSGNTPRSVPPRVTPIVKESNLFTGVYLPASSEVTARAINAEPVALLTSTGTNTITATTITYEPIVAEASAEDTQAAQDQAITPFIDQSPRSGGSGRSRPSPSVFQPPTTEPISPIAPSPPTTPRTPFNPPQRTTPPPRENPPTIFARLNRNKSEDLFSPGFNVEARIGGIFKRISRSPLSLKEAIGFGSSVVGSSPAATFRVSKSSQPATGRFFGSSMIGDFDRRAGGIFVEKDEKRINTPGELVGITRKGQAAIKNRKVFGK